MLTSLETELQIFKVQESIKKFSNSSEIYKVIEPSKYSSQALLIHAHMSQVDYQFVYTHIFYGQVHLTQFKQALVSVLVKLLVNMHKKNTFFIK